MALEFGRLAQDQQNKKKTLIDRDFPWRIRESFSQRDAIALHEGAQERRDMNTLASLVLALVTMVPMALGATPTVGERPPDFKLSTPEGKVVQLSAVMARGPVVLVVLRGYPGYQCPYCNLQVQDFIANSRRFSELGAHVLLVYPGPPQDLNGKAAEFLVGKQLPADFDLVLDPGYSFTSQYGLRWNAQNETAYPSTFLINKEGVVFFLKIVKEHGARTTASELIDAMPKARK